MARETKVFLQERNRERDFAAFALPNAFKVAANISKDRESLCRSRLS